MSNGTIVTPDMDAKTQEWLNQLLAYAAQLPSERREEAVRQACAGREDLLAVALETLKTGPSPSKTTAPGRSAPMIGPYRVLRELGKGGMGIVYLAVRDDGAFKKNVAIKLLRGDAVTREFLERFRHERQVLANFDHPNIARILDGGDTTEGMPFYVMEYVEGRPIDRHCDEEKLSLNDRLKLFQKLCGALQYLHQNQVIHRDLKPGNIMVSTEGVVKLLDFGIAKQLGPASMELTTADGTPLTPAYASPEQFTGRADARSDIYTLGVILYLMLTGKLPDQGTIKPPSESVREDTQRTQETTKQLKKRLMGDLDLVVLKAMHRESRLRYGSAQELSDDLDRFMSGQPVLARTRQGVSAKTIGIAAAAMVAVLGGGAAVFFLQPKPTETAKPPVEQNSVPPQPSDPVVAPLEKGMEKSVDVVKPGAAPEVVGQPKQVPKSPPTLSLPTPSAPAQSITASAAPVVAAAPAAKLPEGLEEARDKYANVAGKVAATDELFQKVKADLEAKGLSVRSDTLSRVMSMKMNLEQAKQSLDRMDVAGALKNLSTAEAQAGRVSKEFGR